MQVIPHSKELAELSRMTSESSRLGYSRQSYGQGLKMVRTHFLVKSPNIRLHRHFLMSGTGINQHPEIWESEAFAEGLKLPNLWVLVNSSPRHEEGPG